MMNLDLGDTKEIIKECKRQQFTKEQCAYVLATAYWETARTMEPVREAYWLSENWRKNNLRYYPWYGRGYVQLTWANNYERAGKKIGVDLTSDPDRALIPDYAVSILVTGMKEGWFTGKKISDYVRLGLTDYNGARRVINGTDKADTIGGIAKEYEHLLVDYDKKEMDWSWLHDLLKNIMKVFER